MDCQLLSTLQHGITSLWGSEFKEGFVLICGYSTFHVHTDIGCIEGSWMLDSRYQTKAEWEWERTRKREREREMACWPSSAAVFSHPQVWSYQTCNRQVPTISLCYSIFQFAYPCCNSIQTFPGLSVSTKYHHHNVTWSTYYRTR